MLGLEFFDQCPKSVFAALAVSLAVKHDEATQHDIRETLLLEWRELHVKGIVSQKPIKLKIQG